MLQEPHGCLHGINEPCVSAGALPLFPGTSEFDALQLAAAAASSQLRSKSERHALRSWLMSPHHFVCVVQAAWLLLALVFKQDDPQAKHVQVRTLYAYNMTDHLS